MTAKQCADIKPTGMRQRDIVDLFYMIITSFRGIAAKLDADAGVTDTDFLATIDALMNIVIEDSKGHYLNLAKSASSTLPETIMISPIGFNKARYGDLLYMLYSAWTAMCAKLDADGNPPTSTDYNADCYTAIYLHSVENSKGATLGNGNNYFIRNGAFPQDAVVAIFYEILDGIETFCEQADTDVAPADADYESLWYTNNITLTVEKSTGDRIGN